MVEEKEIPQRIEPCGEEGKYKLISSEPAKKLDNPIPLSDALPSSMQSCSYTNIGSLKKAKIIKDLFD